MVPEEHDRPTHGARNWIRYHFENLLSRGTWAVLLWLFAITAAVVLLSSVVLTTLDVSLGGSDGDSWIEDFWQSAMRTLDPGTMADDVGWGPRLIALVVTMLGVLIAGALIGIIVSGVELSIARVQRGRSVVVERDHVVILGASSRLPVVIGQLALAGKTRRRSVIVVLANEDPVELGQRIRSDVGDLHGTRLVFRWGDPSRRSDLTLVALDRARVAIALADDDATNDAAVLKTVLSAGDVLGGFAHIPIVAELGDPRTAANLLQACGGLVSPVVPTQAVAAITTYALSQPGLSQVVQEILDFHGADIYVREPGELAGRSFGEAVGLYQRTRPIGRMRSDGTAELKPGPDTILSEDDRLIVLAEDDRPPTIAQPPVAVDGWASIEPSSAGPDQRVEHVVILGWNSLGERFVEQLDSVVATGSTLQVVYDPRLLRDVEIEIADHVGLDVSLIARPSRTLCLGDDEHRGRLTSIVLLGYRSGLSSEEADGRTLIHLMLVKQELRALGIASRIVVELLDEDSIELARTSGADDFVVSDAIASCLMTQLADEPGRRAVLESLQSAAEPSFDLIDASVLGIDTGTEIAFGSIIETAYSYGWLALGWRRSIDRGGESTLNPEVTDVVELGDGDQIIVVR